MTDDHQSGNSNRCEFCQKIFRRETSLKVHLCEPKRRNNERHEAGVRLGLACYQRFFEITQGSAHYRDWNDFVTSAYYRAFVKFGRYCCTTKTIDTTDFLEWLIKHKIKLDHWARDSSYERYLTEHVMQETVSNALIRAIECAQDWQENTGYPAHDMLRFANDNLLCHRITTGHITGWVLYNCDSGREFLQRLNSEQVSMIWNHINSEIWQKKFLDYPADSAYAQEILKKAKW